MTFFDVVFRTEGSLLASREPHHFVSEYRGVVRCSRNDRPARAVGRVHAYRIHADLAREYGVSLFDVCDAHSQAMMNLYASLFDVESDDIAEPVRRQLEVLGSDIFVLDYVLLAPRWRGLRLGLLAARKAIDLLAGGCGMVTTRVAPLNPNGAEFADVPEGWIPAHENKYERRAARQTLRHYFRRLGLRRVGRTGYDGLSLTRVAPTLLDLLHPESAQAPWIGPANGGAAADDGPLPPECPF